MKTLSRSEDIIIVDGDILHRYIFKSDYVPSRNEARTSAFLPQNKYPNELSVYLQRELTLEQIWDIGYQYVGVYKGGSQPKATGELIASDVKRIKNDVLDKYLSLHPLYEPHRYHTNIANVQTSSPKDLLIAEKLLKIAKIIPRE
ncbi:MAG: hypothetical protein ACOVP4_13840 [Bacteriovoracaceae bacterium]